MLHTIVLTIIGQDRPGIVDAVSDALARRGGNWLESSMARLAGQFAGVVRATIPADQLPALEADLRALAGLKVAVSAVESDQTAASDDTAARQGWVLELVGQDQPGIVHRVSHALAERGINLRELHTACFSAPMSGESMFRAVAALSLPEGADIDELRRRLESIAQQLALDLSLTESAEASHLSDFR
jgi:glycine cleavage system regulatory protein